MTRDDQDHSEGRADAPVTLVVYGNVECPYCSEAYPILKAVRHAMGDRLRFAFRHFPITGPHPHAGHAAAPNLFINGARYIGDRDVASLIAAIETAAGARHYDGSIERLMLV